MTKDQEYTHARAIGAEIFGSANEAEFWRLRAEIVDLEAYNADLLAAAEALLDRLDTMTTEEFRHGGEREQRESLHAEVQKSKLWWAEKERNRK